MKTLKRIRYYTMNSWNLSTAPAYNLKIYNVINNDLQDKVYELLECEDYHFQISQLINDFDLENDYNWQAGFNGRSGGYLVLYRGGIKDNKVFSTLGEGIEDNEVPGDVLKHFRKLAINIIKTTEYIAREYNVIDEVVEIPTTVKVLQAV